MADGQVVFDISADGKKAYATIDDVTRAMAKAGKDWEKTAEDSAEGMQKSFAKALDINRVKDWALQAGKALLDFGKEALSAASDLEEVQNVVDVTFGENAAKIDSWAKTAISQFGLTETKAKQFASTLGAMMKSAGVSGDSIVSMSENMAGLAADMASFYNLDFETAFQKIRSGISGETEPLKQLGINMSVANLNAYALKQGLEKTFDQMTQGEQTMLRYQYIMSATADAQGDFARTSDGFANSQRLLESNFEQLQVKAGQLLVGPLAELTTWANTTLDKLLNPGDRTVLDTFKEIDLDTANKLAELEKITGEANVLIGVLESIASKDVHATGFETAVGIISSDMGSLESAIQKARDGNFAGALGDITGALEMETGIDASVWADFLQAISEDLPAATNATSGDGGNTAAFLKAAGENAKKLGDKYPGMWGELLNVLGAEGTKNALQWFQTYSDSAGTLGILASGANELNRQAANKWSGFVGAFANSEGFKSALSAAKQNDYPSVVSGLAEAMSSITDVPADKWNTLLGEIKNNLPDTNNMTAEETTSAFLDAAADAANKLGGEYPGYWKQLVEALGSDNAAAMIGSLNEGEGAAEYLQGIAQNANRLSINAGDRWKKLIEGFKDNDAFKGVLSAARENDYPSVVSNLASALGNITGVPEGSWSTLLGEISDLPSMEGAGSVTDFLSAGADAAIKLGGEYPEYWKKLVEVLGTDNAAAMVEALSGGEYAGTYLGTIADSANKLDASSRDHWAGWMRAVQSVTGTTFGKNLRDSTANINKLAKALSGEDVQQSRAAAFQSLISTLAADSASLAELGGTDQTGVIEFLQNLASEANKLDPDSADGWDVLLTALATGFSGKLGSEEGKTYRDTMAEYFLSLGNKSEAAVAGLKALGYSTDEIDESQQMWLQTIQKLAKTIPGLADIVNTETGAVEGGADALRDYVEEYKRQQEGLLLWKAHFAKKEALAAENDSMVGRKLDVLTAQRRVERVYQEAEMVLGADVIDYVKEWSDQYPFVKKMFYDDARNHVFGEVHLAEGEEGEKQIEAINKYLDAKASLNDAERDYQTSVESLTQAEQNLQDEEAALNGMYADSREAAEEAANATNDYGDAVESATSKATTALGEALTELENYVNGVKQATESSVSSVIKGFGMIETPADKARKKVKDLKQQLTELKEGGDSSGIIKSMGEAEAEIPTISNMTEALKDQLKYMQEYQANMAKARALGVSEDILAMLSDGSVESFDYLAALASGDGDIEALNAVYKQIQDEKGIFVDALTESKLKADKVYDELAAKAQAAVNALNKEAEAKEAASDTIEGLVNGLKEAEPDLATEVDNILAILSRLGQFSGFNSKGFRFTGTVTGNSNGSAGSGGEEEVSMELPYSNANGLEYVPFDNYFSALHEGEAVLTAAEARVWRGIKNGGTGNSIDYDALGGALQNGIRGGNVYLDGRIVGRVISERQADSYRALERSGWQG